MGSRSISTVFLDRDGVINANRPDHVRSWADFEVLPDALRALAHLSATGKRVFVATNQAIIGRGLVTHSDITRLHDQMKSLVAAHGGRIEAVLMCPHAPEDRCGCRKPAPGLLLEAAHRFRIRLDEALFIGDHFDDLEAARRAGCRSMLVLSGRVRAASLNHLPDGCLGVYPSIGSAVDDLDGARVHESDRHPVADVRIDRDAPVPI